MGKRGMRNSYRSDRILIDKTKKWLTSTYGEPF